MCPGHAPTSGYDSTGFALYGTPVRGPAHPAVAHSSRRINTGAALDALEGSLRERGVTARHRARGRQREGRPDRFVRVVVQRGRRTRSRTSCARSTRPAITSRLQSIGRSLEIIQGTCGDAHTVNRAPRRRSPSFVHRTASGTCADDRVRSSTSPTAPLRGRVPFPDIFDVHNGQITNYFASAASSRRRATASTRPTTPS